MEAGHHQYISALRWKKSFYSFSSALLILWQVCQPHQVRSEFEIFEQIVISFSGTHWSPWNDCLCFSYRARGALDRIVEKPNFFTIFLEFVYGLVTPFALCRQSLQSVFANWALENFRCVKLGPGYFFGGKLGL